MKGKRWGILLTAIALCGACPAVQAASGEESLYTPVSSFASYTYNYWGDPVECPAPYTVTRTVTGVDIGVGELKKPNDMAVGPDGDIYLAVSGDAAGDNRIIRLDGQLNLLKEWTGCLDADGQTVPFQEPLGVFVDTNGDIYVADGASQNIYHMDGDCRLKRTILPPDPEENAFIDEAFVERYRPSKLAVDSSGRIHVVAINVNEGIVEFDPDGKFEGFLAAGKVNASALEILWKKLSSQEQLDRMADFVPIEYNNIALDQENFIFASAAAIDEGVVLSEIRSGSGTEQGALVRRLNMLGNDILRRNGFGPPVGDYPVEETIDNIDAAYQGISRVVDIACGDNGCYSLLDNNRNRIFTYNAEGYLLYAFGGPDETAGGFRTPCSIVQYGSYLYVLDSSLRSVTQFTRTEFGDAIADAIQYQDDGQYDAARTAWEKVLAMDANYDLAYSGVGKTLYQYGEYEQAMRMFKLGNDRTWYSRAFKEYSKELVSRWFAPAAVVLAAILAAARLLAAVIHRRRKRRKPAGGE